MSSDRIASEPHERRGCVRGDDRRLAVHAHASVPDDFEALVARLRSADDVLCVLCTGELADAYLPFILPAPLAVPPLAERSAVEPLAIVDSRHDPGRIGW